MWLRHAAWIGVLALLAVIGWRAAGRRTEDAHSAPAKDVPATVLVPTN
jgi:hypothetical protein